MDEHHLVVGAGISGSITALLRRRAGYRVTLVEAAEQPHADAYPLCAGGSNIVSENHSGSEYPYDDQTARDCLDGRLANERFFPETIYAGKDYSRILASAQMCREEDIVARCQHNLDVLRRHYEQRINEDPSLAVFGAPEDSFVQLAADDLPPVADVAAGFMTPQRGMNPVMVAAALDHALREAGVEVRSGTSVSAVETTPTGTFQVTCESGGTTEVVPADQVALCASFRGLALARRLSSSFEPPQFYAALRQILFVDLPDGSPIDYSCLKLEDRFGGMVSPVGQAQAIAYYPPAAHIDVVPLDARDCTLPEPFPTWLREGHPEQSERAEVTLTKLREWYGFLAGSSVSSAHLKIALNTVTDSRVRRNPGLMDVVPGCTVSVLVKWTMAVVNAQQDLRRALRLTASRTGESPDWADERWEQVRERPCLEAGGEEPWLTDPAGWTDKLRHHAATMGVPADLATAVAPQDA